MPLGEVVAVDYPQFDISNPSQIQETIAAICPELVINASAYTDVDKAEQLFAEMSDPSSGEPILINPNAVLVMPAYRYAAAKV